MDENALLTEVLIRERSVLIAPLIADPIPSESCGSAEPRSLHNALIPLEQNGRTR